MRSLVWGTAAGILSLVGAANAGERNWYVAIEAGISDTSASGTQYFPATSFAVFGGDLSATFPILATPDGASGLLASTAVDFSTLDHDESVTFLATIGTHLTESVRIEAELARRSADFGSAEIGQTTVIVNAAYDVPLIDKFSLSLGAGVGVDRITLDTPSANDSSLALALQATAGVSYALSDGASIVLNYRYLDAPGSSVGSISTGAIGETQVEDLSDSAITLGIRFGL
ncbi:MAG: porin family protein [Alphaproteobacteria bacterium]|nr:porin family protein [Alphaproteobacteria bacterium]